MKVHKYIICKVKVVIMQTNTLKFFFIIFYHWIATKQCKCKQYLHVIVEVELIHLYVIEL